MDSLGDVVEEERTSLRLWFVRSTGETVGLEIVEESSLRPSGTRGESSLRALVNERLDSLRRC